MLTDNERREIHAVLAHRPANQFDAPTLFWPQSTAQEVEGSVAIKKDVGAAAATTTSTASTTPSAVDDGRCYVRMTTCSAPPGWIPASSSYSEAIKSTTTTTYTNTTVANQKSYLTIPPKATIIENSRVGGGSASSNLGFSLIASQDIEPGEIIAIDYSVLTIPSDPKVYLNSRTVQGASDSVRGPSFLDKVLLAPGYRNNNTRAAAAQQNQSSNTSGNNKKASGGGGSSSISSSTASSGGASLDEQTLLLAQLYTSEQERLFADCDFIIQKGLKVFGPSFVSSRGLQAICALLIEYGDTMLLEGVGGGGGGTSSSEKGEVASSSSKKGPSSSRHFYHECRAHHKKISKEGSSSGSESNSSYTTIGEKTQEVFRSQLQLKSDTSVRLIGDMMRNWCQHFLDDDDDAENIGASETSRNVDGNDSSNKISPSVILNKKRAQLMVADAILDCIPSDYFVSLETACLYNNKSSGQEGQQRRGGGNYHHHHHYHMGFLSRIGLDRPETLALFLAIVDCNALDMHVPSLPHRMGLFPFVRLFQHECRPSCCVGFLDNPETHADLWCTDVEDLTRKIDLYGDEDPSAEKAKKEKKNATKGIKDATTTGSGSTTTAKVLPPFQQYASRKIFATSCAIITAMRPIKAGEALSISYIPSTYLPCPLRRQVLLNDYHFLCSCKWCTTEPDFPRAFRCPKCERNCGVICPIGDGLKWDLWECLQCGFHPSYDQVQTFLIEEQKLATVKADKTIGMASLLANDFLHYTHTYVFRKADAWAEIAWQEQDAKMCLNYVELLMKCVGRVLQAHDPAKAQYSEFYGQINHALGNAHTSKHSWNEAYEMRVKAGMRLTYWAARTRYMARDKTLADLMDSK